MYIKPTINKPQIKNATNARARERNRKREKKREKSISEILEMKRNETEWWICI